MVQNAADTSVMWKLEACSAKTLRMKLFSEAGDILCPTVKLQTQKSCKFIESGYFFLEEEEVFKGIFLNKQHRFKLSKRTDELHSSSPLLPGT